MAARLKEIAEIAGVSKATASLALNDSPLVASETKEKVRQIARELGYSPNALARSLVRRKSGTIGLIVPDIESAFYGRLVGCVDGELRRVGYGLILAISNDSPQIEQRCVETLISDRVEGAILVPINRINTHPEYIARLAENNVPCVYVTARYPEDDIPCAMTDLGEGTRMLVGHLLDGGRRSIVFLAGEKNAYTTKSRIDGYIAACRERGLAADPVNFVECEKLDYAHACKATAALLRAGRKADAVIAINDVMAVGVLNTLRAAGIRVPEDIAVAGYDDMIYSSISPVPITTVRQNMALMSRRAVELLRGRIAGGPPPQGEIVLIRPELIVRQSTGGA